MGTPCDTSYGIVARITTYSGSPTNIASGLIVIPLMGETGGTPVPRMVTMIHVPGSLLTSTEISFCCLRLN